MRKILRTHRGGWGFLKIQQSECKIDGVPYDADIISHTLAITVEGNYPIDSRLKLEMLMSPADLETVDDVRAYAIVAKWIPEGLTKGKLDTDNSTYFTIKQVDGEDSFVKFYIADSKYYLEQTTFFDGAEYQCVDKLQKIK